MFIGYLLAIIGVALVALIAIQIGKVSELAAEIRGRQETQFEANRFNGAFGVAFMVLFLFGCIISAWRFKNSMLLYGPNVPASEHGASIDFLFNVTLVITGVVFFLTHVFLFWFANKYRAREGSKAQFIAHNDKLEMVWMAIPAVAMTVLVVQGLVTWNHAMADIPADAVLGKDYIEIEATGQQFGWVLRYPGKDNALGDRDFRKIDASNPLGQDWTDKRNLDDFHPDEVVLPVNKPIRVRITSKDVLHNFYLPHFRVKMDAVPGMPTYFVFTPTITSDSMRTIYSKDPDWQSPSKSDPEKKRWETFNYELACAELCGKSHYAMRRVVRIVSEKEYEEWCSKQVPYFAQNIKGTPNDPNFVKAVGEVTPPPSGGGQTETHK